MKIFIGVDGGGSKTEGLFVDWESERVCRILGPATNPNSVGWEVTAQRLRDIVVQGIHELEGSMVDVEQICFAVAGVGNTDHRDRLTAALECLLPGTGLFVTTDALAALTAGAKGQAGVVLAVGTGSIAIGENASGHEFRAGGYGYLVGDEGSGFDIGRRGLMAAIASAEHRGTETRLWDVVRQDFGVHRPIDVVPFIYGNDRPVTVVASFAAKVIALADIDLVANGIVESAVNQHTGLVDSVNRQMHGGCDHVIVSGGLYTSSDVMFEKLQRIRPDYPLVRSDKPPVAGALLRATLQMAREDVFQKATYEITKKDIVERWDRLRLPR